MPYWNSGVRQQIFVTFTMFFNATELKGLLFSGLVRIFRICWNNVNVGHQDISLVK